MNENIKMKSTVELAFTVEGFHNYPNAPDKVKFLSHNHRHSFDVKCGYEVKDLNREKEIFLCREKVIKYIYETYKNPCRFNNMSCEMIAKEILIFGLKDNMIWCSVWEEKTGGAKVEI